jgi:hypothetical protein
MVNKYLQHIKNRLSFVILSEAKKPAFEFLLKCWILRRRAPQNNRISKYFSYGYFILFSAITISYAGEKNITGNLGWDLTKVTQDTSTFEKFELQHSNQFQNSFYNSLFSLVLPGSGQYRTERYTKAAIFLGAEVALITYAIISNNNGNKKTDEFQRYAEAHWDAVRYARWINNFGVSDYGPQLTTPIDEHRVANKDYSQINAWESASHSEGFSHQLPRFGEQQYYELIGKYRQFKFGWDQYPDLNNDGIPDSDNRQYDNLFTAENQITSYMTERARANDYYYAASFAVSVLVINHVLSAVDAYLSTKSFNKEISATLGMRPVDSVEGKRLLSELRISVGF